MLSIQSVNDSDFLEIDLPKSAHEGDKIGYKYIFNNLDNYDKEIVIAPHYNETYISLELFKLSIYCKKNRIKITSIGSMNQFTFFGLFSDEVICLKDTHLHNIYSSNYSSFGTDASYFSQIPNFKDIYGGGMGMHGFEEANEISIDEVINKFVFPNIYIRSSTIDYFRSLSLPSNSIYCEVKTHFYPKLTSIIKNNFPDAIGLDKNFQRDLLKEAGDHFMGVQLLASLFKGWQFIAAGGSVNLFNVLPVRPLCFLENQDDLTSDFIKAALIFSEKRYGAKPNFINFSPRICSNGVSEDQDASLGDLEQDLPRKISDAFDVASKSCKTLYSIDNYKEDEGDKINIIIKKKEKFDNEINIKIKNKVINWVFQYNHDFNFFKKNILDWAIKDYEHTENAPDFTVGVYINNAETFQKIGGTNSQKFLLSAESHTRHPVLDNCHSFVQDARPNENDPYIRYAPTMCCWSPPISKNESTLSLLAGLSNPPNLISAIDSGMYPWRKEMIRKFSESFDNKIDLFGGGYNKSLGGYHYNTNSKFLNEKYISLQPYLFSLAIENNTALYSQEDYITEKVTDPILCESIPICQSAPNLSDYFIEDSYILLSDVEKLDKKNLPIEYMVRRDKLLLQKEFLRTHFNVFSYFNRLTDDLSLLNQSRPIKIT